MKMNVKNLNESRLPSIKECPEATKRLHSNVDAESSPVTAWPAIMVHIYCIILEQLAGVKSCTFQRYLAKAEQVCSRRR